MAAYIAVFFGAGLGGITRHAINLAVLRAFGAGFPYATMLINISGSLLMGLIAGYFAMRGEASQTLRLFLTTGILGGYTTFSAFSLDAGLLYERGQLQAAAAYVVGSVAVSLGGLFLGLFVIRQLP
ncbi:fluoride efflux transporter CrcB [Methyloraptor flagellatus]|uniref:Fluoride-specific ion channel FluC n=1 Tax=Methyloraptor flagellatus TaxID=3162530 RepID=A0AAU7XJT8_9HYPH